MNEDIIGRVLTILSHPIRCGIIKITSSKPNGVSYTELLTELQLSTGRLNYHLRQMEGFLEKNNSYHYIVTPLGEKAAEILTMAKEEIKREPGLAKYYHPSTPRGPLLPLMRSMACILIVGVCVPIFFIGVTVVNTLSVGGELDYIIFNIIALAIAIATLVWLVFAFKKGPHLVEMLERKLYE